MRRLALIVATLLWASPALAIGTINIANAPEWQSSHAYGLKDRIVAGAAWNGSTYTNGQPLCLFAVKTAGTTSADPTVYNTACASGTPAAVGGGLDGSIPSGWASATTVTDGGVVWALLTRVDYVSITGYSCDDSRNWTGSTTYHHLDSVVNGGNCYTENNTFAGTDPCTSASSGGPTGTAFNTNITDNTCNWLYQGKLTYSSQANRLPHQTQAVGAPTGTAFVIGFAQNVTVQIWWGGAQRTHYGPGEANELSPMQTHYHQDLIGDALIYCDASQTTTWSSCNGTGIPFYVKYAWPVGDRIQDNVKPATGPLDYDETKGTALYTNAAVGVNGAGNTWALGDSATIINLQIQSTQGIALPTTGDSTHVSYLFGPTNTNEVWLQQSIVIGAIAAAVSDYGWNIDNSLLIANSGTTGATPLHSKYQNLIHDSTLICAGGASNSTGYERLATLGGTTEFPINNNLVLGCANPYAGTVSATSGQDNATDVSGTPSGTFTDPLFGGTLTIAALPGTTLTGLTAANQLVNPTVGGSFDGRVKNTSANIYGAAATFSFTDTGGFGLVWMSPVTPGTDILGTNRPVSGRYDIGAEMFIPASAASALGRRWWLH